MLLLPIQLQLMETINELGLQHRHQAADGPLQRPQAICTACESAEP